MRFALQSGAQERHCSRGQTNSGAAFQLGRDCRQRLRELLPASTMKRFLFGLLGKDPEAVIVSFWTGEDSLVLKMIAEIRELLPARDHYVVTIGPAPVPPGFVHIQLDSRTAYLQLRRALRRKRVGLAPVLFTAAPPPLRAIALCLAPRKI